MEIDEEEPPANIKKGQWSQKYNEEYGQMFPVIENSSRGETYAYCTVSGQHFSVSHGGTDDMIKHVSTVLLVEEIRVP